MVFQKIVYSVIVFRFVKVICNVWSVLFQRRIKGFQVIVMYKKLFYLVFERYICGWKWRKVYLYYVFKEKDVIV